MTMYRSLFVLPVLSAALLAQKIEFKPPPTQDQPLRYSLQTKLKTTETSKRLVNGAEPEAGGAGGRGGGGGGGGEMSLAQEIVFDEGPSSAPWRDYKTVTATQTRPGRDGTQETKIEGGLQGKKVTLKTGDGGKVAFTEGEGDKQTDVAAALVRGVPGRISFLGFLPDHGVATGEEFDVGKSFLPALRNLAHAVNRAPSEDAGGTQGGGQGGRGQGGRGQGGRGQGDRPNVVLQLLSGGKFDVDAKGKVTGVDNDIATLAIKAKLTGKGTNEEMGIMGGFGGMGGRGQGGGAAGGGAGGGAAAPAGTSKVDASFDLTGTVRFDLKAQRVVGVEFAGDVQVGRESSFKMQNRDGEEQKIDTTSQSKGKVELKATCETVAAAK